MGFSGRTGCYISCFSICTAAAAECNRSVFQTTYPLFERNLFLLFSPPKKNRLFVSSFLTFVCPHLLSADSYLGPPPFLYIKSNTSMSYILDVFER